MEPPTTFETPRLRLRRPAPDDAADVFAGYAQDPAVTKSLMWCPHGSLDTVRDFLEGRDAAWAAGPAFAWAIAAREDGQVLGMVEVPMEGHRAEVGYLLARAAWGRGLVTEAVRAVVEWALAERDIYRVWAVCDIENQASARVLEKVGMQREGVLRRRSILPNVSDVPRDCWCYAKVKVMRR